MGGKTFSQYATPCIISDTTYYKNESLQMKITPDKKGIEVSPADLLVGKITFRIHKDLPLKIISYKEKNGLVIEIIED